MERPRGAVPGRGGVRVEVMSSLAGELSAVDEFFAALSVRLLEQRVSKAIGLGDDGDVEIGRREPADLPRPRRTRAKYFPSDWLRGQRRAHRLLLQIAEDRRPRMARAGSARAHAVRAGSLCHRPDHARQRVADRGPERAQARRDRGARAPRSRAAGHAGFDHHRSAAVADLGADRLDRHPAARERRAEARSAPEGSARRSCARGSTSRAPS